MLGSASLYIGLGRWLQVWVGDYRICVAGTIATLGGNAVGVSFGTLREGAGQSLWSTTTGEGCGAFRAGYIGGLAVTLEKKRESVWIPEN